VTTDTITVSFGSSSPASIDCSFPSGTYTTKIVTVNPLPTPSISGPATVCAGYTGINYTTSLVSGHTYSWTISGGTITSGQYSNTAIVTWGTGSSGWLTVTDTITATGCYATTAQYNVTINPLPTPSISGPITVCANSTGNVYSTASVSGHTYSWSISSGGTITSASTNNSVTVTWNTPGSGWLTVTETITATGCAVTTSQYAVTINALLTPSISGNNSVCVNSTTNTYTTQPGMTGYNWTFLPSGSGTINNGSGTSTVTVTWNMTGIQNINVNYTNPSGCQTTGPGDLPVTVNQLPSPTITSGQTLVCINSTFPYSTQSGMTGYIWTVTGGTIVNGQNTPSILVNWNTVGVESMSVIYTSNGCNPASPGTLQVTVNPLPTPSISGPTTICLNDPNNKQYSTQTNMSNYIWNVVTGGTLVSGQWTPTIIVDWQTEGSHEITVNYTDANGCTRPDPGTLMVNVNPIALVSVFITANPGNIICTGDSVTFNADASGGGSSPVYQWFRNTSPVGNDLPFWACKPQNGDRIWVRLTSNAPCPSVIQDTSNIITMEVSNSVTPQVTIEESPLPPSCFNKPVTLSANTITGGNNPRFVWLKNGLQFDTGASITRVPVDGEIIVCSMVSSLQCAAPGPVYDTMTMDVRTSITASVSISVEPDSIVCYNWPATFTAHDSGGGENPKFEWRVGDALYPNDTGRVFILNYVRQGDIVRCRLMRGLTCASPMPSPESNSIDMQTKEPVVVSVTVTPSSNSSCAGDTILFTAMPSNGGSSPSYQWRVNDMPVGINSNKFKYVPIKNDTVTCVLSSSELCKIGDPATSFPIVMIVNEPVNPTPIIAGQSQICQGYPNSYSTTNTSNVIEEWQYKTPNGVWTQVPSSDSMPSIIDTADVVGHIQYRTVIKSGSCPEKYSDPIDVLVLEAPGHQILVPKADAEHEKKGDLFLLCTSCNNSTDYTYEWSYLSRGGVSTVDTTFHEYFCIFPRDTSYTYVLKMGYPNGDACQTLSTYEIPKSSMISNMISVFPVPNDGRFTLSLDGAYTGEISIIVQDLVGRTLVHSMYQKQSESMQIPFNLSLEKGLYLISVLFGNDEKVTTRIMIY
jgi:hypothetical protein